MKPKILSKENGEKSEDKKMSKAKKCDRCGKFYEKNVVMESKGSSLGNTIGGIKYASLRR